MYIEVERSLVSRIAEARDAANRKRKRHDGRVSSGAIDLLGAAAELAFSRFMKLPDSSVLVLAGETDPGYDFDLPGIGKVDVKGAAGWAGNLIVKRDRWPPKTPPDWLVLGWVLPETEDRDGRMAVDLRGCCSSAAFERRKQLDIRMEVPAWSFGYAWLMPLEVAWTAPPENPRIARVARRDPPSLF
jgi:hypothetical protein